MIDFDQKEANYYEVTAYWQDGRKKLRIVAADAVDARLEAEHYFAEECHTQPREYDVRLIGLGRMPDEDE